MNKFAINNRVVIHSTGDTRLDNQEAIVKGFIEMYSGDPLSVIIEFVQVPNGYNPCISIVPACLKLHTN